MTQSECETMEKDARQSNPPVSWQEVDRRLSGIAKQRAALDAEEARWLREAARVKIWREVGCVSLLDYLERRLGYGPRAAHDRVRVALALEALPELERSLAGGMPYTAVRELTRVATRETEQTWIDAARGKSVHEIEQAVSGHRKGSLPSDPAEPDLAMRTLSFEEVSPATIALMRQARQKAQAERGVYISDNELLALAFGAVIDGGKSGEDRGRAKFQIAVTLCPRCEDGRQEGGGRQFAMEKADVERAKCDAQYIGSLDGDPERAKQDIPPSVRRFVLRRDGGKCTVPGCRSSSNLEIHHLKHRANGGSHDPLNLTAICDGHHASDHRGEIAVGGTPGNITITRKHALDPADANAHTNEAPVGARTELTTIIAPRSIEIGAPGTITRQLELDTVEPPHANEARARVGTNESHEEIMAPRSIEICAPGTIARDTVEPPTGTHANEAHAHVDTNESHDEVMAPRSRFERTAIRTQALDALVTLGFKRHEARVAVDEAVAHFGDASFTLETFVRVALSKSPRPRGG